MDVSECIKTTRATRKFTDESVPKQLIEELIDHARYAGSGHNRQPWTFVAIRDDAERSELAACGSYTSPLTEAPVGIVIATEKNESRRRNEHNVLDCGRALQNLMLAGHAIGLGVVPQGIHDRERAASVIELPATKRVLIAIAVGYPADQPATTIEGVPKFDELSHPGRKPVSAILHYDTHSPVDSA